MLIEHNFCKLKPFTVKISSKKATAWPSLFPRYLLLVQATLLKSSRTAAHVLRGDNEKNIYLDEKLNVKYMTR